MQCSAFPAVMDSLWEETINSVQLYKNHKESKEEKIEQLYAVAWKNASKKGTYYSRAGPIQREVHGMKGAFYGN